MVNCWKNMFVRPMWSFIRALILVGNRLRRPLKIGVMMAVNDLLMAYHTLDWHHISTLVFDFLS